MEYTEMFETLTLVFRTVFKNEQLTIQPDYTANEVDGWDSLTHIVLIAEIEDKFAIKFKLKELNKMNNVGMMLEIIQSKLNQ